MDLNRKIDIISFLHQFFLAHQCTILSIGANHLHVQLTKELDQALMNRPFYWQYIEATGRLGEPKSLAFTTNMTEESPQMEWIHHGSPRLHQIYEYIQKNNRIIQLFEVHQTNQNTLLQPWLLTNYAVQYKGKQQKEAFFSIGLNLINGTIANNMMERLEKDTLSPTISDYCYTISPLITWQSGFKRIEQFISDLIVKENHTWAEMSLQVMKEEIDMVYHFYDEENREHLDKEIKDIKSRLEPTITHKVINGGIVYLSESFLS